MTAKTNNITKDFVDIDETIFKHCLFLFTSCNEQNLNKAVDTAFNKFATKEFITNMAMLFDLTVDAYKKDLGRRIVNEFNSKRLKQR